MTGAFKNYNPAADRRTRRLVLIAATILVIACMALVNAVMPRSLALPVSAQTPVPTVPYVARALGNQLAVYIEGEDSPALVTDIDVRALPAADREALANGITLSSEEALAKLLEDYGS